MGSGSSDYLLFRAFVVLFFCFGVTGVVGTPSGLCWFCLRAQEEFPEVGFLVPLGGAKKVCGLAGWRGLLGLVAYCHRDPTPCQLSSSHPSLDVSWWEKDSQVYMWRKSVLSQSLLWQIPPAYRGWKALPSLGICGRVLFASAPQPFSVSWCRRGSSGLWVFLSGYLLR